MNKPKMVLSLTDLGDLRADSADVIRRAAAGLAADTWINKDAVITQAIRDSGEADFSLANVEAIRGRGHFEIYPDQSEVFVWDGKPLIRFMPPEIKQEGSRIVIKCAVKPLVSTMGI